MKLPSRHRATNRLEVYKYASEGTKDKVRMRGEGMVGGKASVEVVLAFQRTRQAPRTRSREPGWEPAKGSRSEEDIASWAARTKKGGTRSGTGAKKAIKPKRLGPSGGFILPSRSLCAGSVCPQTASSVAMRRANLSAPLGLHDSRWTCVGRDSGVSVRLQGLGRR